VWDNVQPTFRRALIARAGETTKIEWVFDSAFGSSGAARPGNGYVLDFWDAATNKVLALADGENCGIIWMSCNCISGI